MKHIFLTGEIQIGKSTIINKMLSLLNAPHAGFRTYFGPDRANPERNLYMGAAAQGIRYSDQQVIARFRRGLPPEVRTEVIDALGVYFLKTARKEARLIIMDECGSLENNARIFQNEILETLEGEVPVLGVVKLSSSGWVDEIRNHHRVTLLTVDEDNRDKLPALLVDNLLIS